MAYQGFTYQGLGYRTLEGEVPAAKMLTHWHIGGLIQKYKPKPKKEPGGKHGKK